MRRHERYVLARRAAPAEAGGGLDIVRRGVGHDLAELDLLLVGEHTGLDDDLEDVAVAGDLHGIDLLQDFIVLAFLDPAEVDDHVDLGRAVGYGGLGLHALDAAGNVAVGEADDRAHGQLTEAVVLLLGDVVRGVGDVGLRDADARAAVLDAVVADLADLLPGGGGGEQGMVNVTENFFHIHSIWYPFQEK